MSKIAVGKDYVYAFKRESTFGTADVADMTIIPTESMEINHDYKSHSIPRAIGKRSAGEDDAWQDTVGSIPETTVSFFASEETLPLCPAVLNYDTDYVAVSGVWTYQAKTAYADQPDFSSDEGYFYTLQADGPAQQFNERIISAVGKSLKFSLSPDSNEGALYCEMGFVGKESTINAAAKTGTDVEPDMSGLFKWSDLFAFKFDGTDFTSSLYEFDVEITNAAKPIVAGGGSNMALVNYEGKGSFKLLGSDVNTTALKALVASNAAGSAASIQVQWGDGTVSESGELNLIWACILTGYSLDKSDEETITFEFSIKQTSSTFFQVQHYLA
jgi:hypothetical protein